MKKESAQDLISDSLEFDERNGFVTCETSVHIDDVEDFEYFVKLLTNIKLGRWILMKCETCVKYHGKGYLHASIERFETLEKMKINIDKFVKIIDYN